MKKTYLFSLFITLLFALGAKAEVVTVGTGTVTDNGAPFITNYMYSTTQTIYTAQELGRGGVIHSIAYNCASVGSLSSNVEIYMGYKTSSTFSSTSDCVPASELTLVYSKSQTLSDQTGWVSFDLDSPFYYDSSVGNLAVVVCKSASGWKNSSYYATSTSGKTISRAADNNSSYADIANSNNYSLSNSSPNTRFYIYDKLLEKDGITYVRISSNSARIVNASDATGNVTIPSTITDDEGNTYSVTSIADNAFKDNTSITSISIPESVMSIGNWAFCGCIGLMAVSISEGVTFVGSNAFAGCLGLTSIDLPSSINTIGSAMFSGCSNLERVTVPFIGSNYPFGYYFGSSFYDGSYVASQRYQSGNSIYTADYYIPTKLKSVTVRRSSLRDYSFEKCSLIEQIIVPQDITSIPSNTFYNCSNLSSFVIPESVTSIGSYAFYNCTSLESVTLPFVGGSKATASEASLFGFIFGAMSYSGGKAVSQKYYSNNVQRSITYYIPYSLRSVTITGGDIKYGAFSGCSFLTSISIPETATNIGNYAFEGCTGLKSIAIPKNVINIGDYVFSGCNLRSVTFGAGLLSIGSNAFNAVVKAIWLANTPPTNYSSVSANIHYVANDQYTSFSNKKVYNMLSSSFVANGIKYVPTSMSGRTCEAIDCEYNNNAENINISGSVTYRNVAFKVECFNDYLCCDNDSIRSLSIGAKSQYLGNYAFWDCNNLQTVVIAEDITSIGHYAFSRCTSLTDMVVPNSLTDLGYYAFENCTSLQSVNLGNGIEDIPAYAFMGCTALNDVKIGTGTKAVGVHAFSGCTSLPELTIPNNVTIINNYALNGCKALQKVVLENRETILNLGFNGNNPLFVDCPLDTVYIGGKINYITNKEFGYSPFYRNTTLRSIVIADHEDQIYDNEFYGCTNLKNVTIGDGVKSIGNWAFSGCSSLDHFIFGSALETIGNEAFSDCTAITEITTRRAVPPVCGTQALEDINKWECTLRIPVDNIDAYAAADQWMEFLWAEGLSDDVHTLTFTLDGKLYQLDYHTHGSVIIPPTAPVIEGYTFNGWEDLPSYMPDCDLTINGSYTVNSYKLTYYLDGVEYSSTTVDYGTSISALADPTKEGWYYFSGWNEVPETMPAHNVSIYGTMNPYRLGDVNNDNDISVSDVVGIGNLILGTNTEGLIRAAANVNQDETVSVSDMIYECNVILGNSTIAPPSNARSMQSVETAPSASLEMNDVVLGEDELIISLVNPYDEITGVQFDLYLPEGIRVAEEVDEFDGTVTSDITLMGRTSYVHHALSAAMQEDGAVRILLSSQTLKTISGQEGGIIRVRLEADEMAEVNATIMVDNIELGKADNTCIRPAACMSAISAGEVTGIQTLAGDGDGKSYDMSGRRATDKSRGIVVSQGRKVVRK